MNGQALDVKGGFYRYVISLVRRVFCSNVLRTTVWRIINVSVKGHRPLLLHAALTNLYSNYGELIFCSPFININYRYATRVHFIK